MPRSTAVTENWVDFRIAMAKGEDQHTGWVASCVPSGVSVAAHSCDGDARVLNPVLFQYRNSLEIDPKRFMCEGAGCVKEV